VRKAVKIGDLSLERSAHLYERDPIVAEGIRTVLHAMPSLHLAGESHTPNELAALIESRVEAARAFDAALFELGARATAFLEADDRVEPAMEDLRKLAPMLFGPGIVLDALGVKAPRKKKRRSAGEQRAAWLRELDEPADPARTDIEEAHGGGNE
jgi:hypothetical protein